MITDEDIRKVRDATDLVNLVSETVMLRQKGRDFWGRCPFHDEKTGSFKVDPRSQLFHCFGCHAGGDAFGYVMRTQNLSFPEAVRYLAERSHITLAEQPGGMAQGKRARLLRVMEESVAFYAQQLLRSPKEGAAAARSYLAGRGMGTEVAKFWQLGYAPGGGALLAHLKAAGFTEEECLEANVAIRSTGGLVRDRFYERVMFPVADVQGKVIAFGGRVMGSGNIKYLNSSDSPLFHKGRVLYALNHAKAHIVNSGTALVVEGYTDTIALHQAGFTNAVATLGTALTPDHLKLLNRFARKVICLFDGDAAGRAAAERAAQLISHDITPEAGRYRFSLEVAELPLGFDPAELVQQQGAAALEQVLASATPLLRYALRQALAEADLSSPEGRGRALRSALTVLLPIRGSLLATEYLAEDVAGPLGIDFTQAAALFASLPDAAGSLSSSASSKASASAHVNTNLNASIDTSANAQARVPAQPVSQPSGSGSGGSGQQPAMGKQASNQRELQCALIALFCEYPEVRALLATEFAAVAWVDEGLQAAASGLIAASGLGAASGQAATPGSDSIAHSLPASSEELYALALGCSPALASELSGGGFAAFAPEPMAQARLLLCMQSELQLQNELALAKISYSQGKTLPQANRLYEEIAKKQSELATIRERLADIPKYLS